MKILFLVLFIFTVFNFSLAILNTGHPIIQSINFMAGLMSTGAMMGLMWHGF